MKNIFHIIDQVLANKVAFLTVFALIFTGTYAVLYAVDFYPEPVTKAQTATTTDVVASSTVINTVVAEPTAPVAKPSETPVLSAENSLPYSLTIDALDRTVTVLNPASNSVAALDAALLKGVIRHPDSATFAEEGNMFILGHSSYLPTVLNRNFQALNGIQNLKWGDTIKLDSKDTQYVYKVEKVYKAKASGFTVPVAGKGNTLTLVTCNSFGSTEDRYIVEATLVSKATL